MAVDQPDLQYYYIFLYFPVDHNEGFVMIHTDSAEESISNDIQYMLDCNKVRYSFEKNFEIQILN